MPGGTIRVSFETNFPCSYAELWYKTADPDDWAGYRVVQADARYDNYALIIDYDTVAEAPDDAQWYVRAKYGSSALDYVSSDYFTITYTVLTLEVTPESEMIPPGQTEFEVSWRANFTPVRIEICKYQNFSFQVVKTETSISGSSGTCSVPYSGERTLYSVRAYFTDDIYKGATFEVYTVYHFTRQPQGGYADTVDNQGNVLGHYSSWETNFIPTSYDIFYQAYGGWIVYETILPNNGASRNYIFPGSPEGSVESRIYKVRAYYGVDKYVDSDEITVRKHDTITLTLNYDSISQGARTVQLERGMTAKEYYGGQLPMMDTERYHQEGWYADADFTTVFTGDEVLRQDTTIYAKLSPKSHTIRFVTNGGTAIEPLVLPYGATITPPETTRTDYILEGWYLDAALTNIFNPYTYTATVDRTLYAKWRPDGVEINATNFPDEGFRSVVGNSNYDKNGDGILSKQELAETTLFYLENSYTSLKGIEYFTELTSLTCVNSQITTLDLSRNTKLQELYLNDNPSLSTLDLSANTALTDLKVNNTALTSLDLSMLPQLYRVFAYDIPTLESIAVSGSVLRILLVYNTGLTALDISSCSQLSAVYQTTPTDQGTYYTYTTNYSSNRRTLSIDKTLSVYTQNDGIEINAVNFPDLYFRAYVSEKFDLDHNGWLNPDEIAGAKNITLANDSYYSAGTIYSLKGIEFFSELLYLDVSNVGVEEVDLSANTKLANVIFQEDSLTSIDVSGLPALQKLDVHSSHNLSSVILGESPVTKLYCYDTAITALDLSGCPYLGIAYRECQPKVMEEGGLTFWAYTLRVEPVPGVEYEYKLYLDPELDEILLPNGIRIDETNFPDDIFRANVSEHFDPDKDGWLIPAEIAAAKYIDVENMKIETLQGVGFFSELEILEAADNYLTSLDLRANTKLTEVDCSENTLIELWVEGLSELEYLACYDNNLKWISLAGLDKLKSLDIHTNGLIGLDVSGLQLTWLYCENNTLDGLVLGEQPELLTLYCYGNHLETLDLSGCPQLCAAVLEGTRTVPSYVQYRKDTIWLRVDGATKLTVPGGIPIDEEHFPDEQFRAYVSITFDTSGNGWLSPDEIAAVTAINCSSLGIASLQGIEYFTALETLNCHSNALTALDLSANTQLKQLDCDNNPELQAMNLTGLTQLGYLDCSDCALPALDLSAASSMTYLECDHNALTSLILGEQPLLTEMYCQSNSFTTLDISGCPYLVDAWVNGTHEVQSWGVAVNGGDSMGGYMELDNDLTVITHTPGDINGDGVANNKDVMRLLRYVKGSDVAVVKAALDVNGDGSVNNKDVMRLLRYVKGNDVVIY